MADGASDSFEIDPALLQEFLQESLDTLNGLDHLFVALERRPDDLAVIDQIFRPVHSIKGNSSFFGLTNIKNFAHTAENLLQEIRNRKRKATKEIIDALLVATDMLRAMVERLAAGDTAVTLLPEEKAHLDTLAAISQSAEASVAELAREAREALDAMAALDLTGEAARARETLDGRLRSLLDVIAPPASTNGATASGKRLYRVNGTDVTPHVTEIVYFIRDIGQASKETARCEAFLQALREFRRVTAEAEAAPLLEAIDALQDEFDTIHQSGLDFDDLLAGLAQERLEEILGRVEICDETTRECTVGGKSSGSLPPAAPAEADKAGAEPAAADAPPPAAARPTPKTGETGGKTLRVAEETVDNFMGYVGELIIASEAFNYIQKKIEALPGAKAVSLEFKNANLSFNELSTNLQRSLMAVRRIPLRQLFQRIPRIVRDLAGPLGKEIDIELEGETVQIDKSLLEGLEDPLVHMVRNAVDHGIEMPDAREADGKPRAGTLRVRAEATEETFRLVIEDDGKGIDVEAIKAKAVANGVLPAERARTMSDKEAYHLVFGAGVSTAKKVTDISGRGVGMDVVLSNITALNGNVDIDSTLGKGSVFTISLPMTVTLLVVDGLVAQVGPEQYIIPLQDVRESIQPTANQVHTVRGKGEVVDIRGEICRLLRLYDLLGVSGAETDPAAGTVVLVEHRGRTCGLLVDELLGQQAVVLKDLGDHFAKLEILRGAAILGDGRVGLVLDVEGILDAATA